MQVNGSTYVIIQIILYTISDIAKALAAGGLKDQIANELRLEEIYGKYSDEFVATRGSFKMVSPQGVTLFSGKDMLVWKYVDGVYLAQADIWNRDDIESK